ncbi:mitochondrial Complex IV (CIV) cytochrome c:O2 oxidoreductase subunit 5b (Cox5b) [Andalucia godoyi]|uniref:Mitochondrial Complex IV (CIV) cytochrome c:O2 oxidoreductase subunit 5b (Cox5b) n=1 Tax=Andalucia godoyi TaxID=505711 RepID=A0A8K0F0K7_ANDGO|nr:mitochondrial Complex IV (CIV) cytochrome c:O2 oxidoreductase subunit 5b (Cox5b) [Andalucia godoyi]|eukprot:ANDGO_00915.mRNA.1 mitochondrial Complex IV (CIV) cytochrome c:O2 oxidoreductase subunit 5b (Cox5b)
MLSISRTVRSLMSRSFAVRRFGSAAPVSSDAAAQPTQASATGPEAEQQHHSFDSGVIVGPFGTKTNPVVVKTVFSERVVGCPGECKEGVNEGLRWWVMQVGSDYECPECGQWFKLVKDASTGHH